MMKNDLVRWDKKIPLCVMLFALLFLKSCQERGSAYTLNPVWSHNKDYLAGSKLIQVSSYDTTSGNNDRINVAAGETVSFFEASGPGVVSRIWITIDSRDPYFLRRILLRMYWDGEKNPSVEVPVGDFFGCGFQYKHHIARYTGMSSGGYYCYFPMPFAKNARMEVVNDTGEEIYAFYYQVDYYHMDQALPGNMPYFHAQWRRDSRTDEKSNYVALEAEGEGYFVGLSLNAQPYQGGLFYLEGDEMIYIDGEEFPSIYGTGLEDYFTSGWYFKDGEFSAPFHGLVLKEEGSGRITAYRHHIPDAIPFYDSVRVTFEHGHGNEEVVDFSTVAFWYQREPHLPFNAIPEPGLRIPLRRPVPSGAVEAESVLEDTPVETIISDMSVYGVDWSENQQLEIDGKRGDTFSVRIPNLLEETYDIGLYLTRGPDYGKLAISSLEDGQKIVFDGYHQEVFPAEKVTMYGLKPVENTLTLEFEIIGKTPASGGYKVGIDAFYPDPVRRFIDDWYIIGPFPNPRESDHLRYGLDSVYAPEKAVDLAETYVGSNGQTVSWKRLTGKTGYDMALWQHFDPAELVVVYALTYVYSPHEQRVPFFIGSDDGAKVFLNGTEIYRFNEVRVAAPDQDQLMLELKRGWNQLLIKAENNFGGYAFYARVVDINKNLVVNPDGNI